jgi:hypothetical protein
MNTGEDHMDVRQYYRKLREIESNITEAYVLVTSLETSDGGKPGVVSEVSREQAAKLIVEGRVTLSTDGERKAFFEKRTADKKAFEKADMARRLQVTIVSAPEEKESKVSVSAITEPTARK